LSFVALGARYFAGSVPNEAAIRKDHAAFNRVGAGANAALHLRGAHPPKPH